MIDFSTAILVLSVAFFSSLGHCLGMCGGFVVALSHFGRSFGVLLGYNLARIFAYILLGALFGAFGGIFSISIKSRGYSFFILGICMILLGVALIWRGKILKFIENNELINNLLNSKISSVLQAKSGFGFLLLGFLNGFLPCGVVYYFLALCVSSGSVLGGISVMALFGVVSLVMMSAYGMIFKILSQNFKKFMLFTSAVLIIGHGIYISFIGFMATNG